ncbi:MAG: hypothetical protein PHD74_05085, partial [Candidatus Krumholzibacteria bacterium]|nr:hypothetical protein [Candidatus Krumholzibacteria bacterium]
LDYLGIEQPAWMIGRSLIAPGAESTRPIFTVQHKHGASVMVRKERLLDKAKIGPPFYSISSIGVILCQRMYLLDLEESVLTLSDINGHTSPCGESDIPSPQEAGQLIIDLLEEDGYDTSSIRTPLRIGG